MTGKDAMLHDVYKKCLLIRLNAKSRAILQQLSAYEIKADEHQGMLVYSFVSRLHGLMFALLGLADENEPTGECQSRPERTATTIHF